MTTIAQKFYVKRKYIFSNMAVNRPVFYNKRRIRFVTTFALRLLITLRMK